MSEQQPPADDAADSGTPATPPPPPPPPSGTDGPPPPPAGVGADAADKPYSVGDALKYGWEKFTANLVPILIAMAIFAVIGLILHFFGSLIQNAIFGNTAKSTADCLNAYNSNQDITAYQDCLRNASTTTSHSGFGWFGLILSGFLVWLIDLIWQYFANANVARGALLVTDEDKKLEVKDVLSADKLGPVLGGGILLSIATVIGLILCILPGLIIAFFGAYYVYFVIGENQGAVESLKSSFNFVKDNLGQLILFFLASLVITFIGALLCGVGLIVALPVVWIAQAYTFRKLRGEPVAA